MLLAKATSLVISGLSRLYELLVSALAIPKHLDPVESTRANAFTTFELEAALRK